MNQHVINSVQSHFPCADLWLLFILTESGLPPGPSILLFLNTCPDLCSLMKTPLPGGHINKGGKRFQTLEIGLRELRGPIWTSDLSQECSSLMLMVYQPGLSNDKWPFVSHLLLVFMSNSHRLSCFPLSHVIKTLPFTMQGISTTS
jgi:hypothetical protein